MRWKGKAKWKGLLTRQGESGRERAVEGESVKKGGRTGSEGGVGWGKRKVKAKGKGTGKAEAKAQAQVRASTKAEAKGKPRD